MRLKFELFKDDWCKKNRGLMAKFTDGKGRSCTHHFTSPSNSISHACDIYLKGKFSNVKTERHADFIRKEYEKKIKLFTEYNEQEMKK